jgi:predicted metal-dependent phosphoesterase TrpH
LTELADLLAAPATRLRRRIVEADRGPLPYLELPFVVPSGVRALRIQVRYDDPGDADRVDDRTVLDVGLLGPASSAHPDAGRGLAFRGWSGSERSQLLVGEKAATPGYRPGPIDSGDWAILLGLYRVATGGSTVEVTIEPLLVEPPIDAYLTRLSPTDRLPTQPSTLATSRRWIAADLHAHSLHSDGQETITELDRRRRQAGIEVQFLTDHNTDAHHGEVGETLGVLPGEEVTTYGGHLNALGARGWIDFRVGDAVHMATVIGRIHAAGGLASVNHPLDRDCGWTFGDDLQIDAVEVWNGPWSTDDDAAITWWDGLLAAGRRVVAVGGSDTHGPAGDEHPAGTPTTWLEADSIDLATVVEAIRAGRVALTRDPSIPPPVLAIEDDGQGRSIHWRIRELATASAHLIVDGAVAKTWAVDGPDAAGSWPLPATDRQPDHVRLEIREAGGALLAMTNPVRPKED